MTEIQLPISKLSYSSLSLLLRNPVIFKLQEILGVYDRKMSVSGMIGRAGHEALKAYYGGSPELKLPEDLNERRALVKEIGLFYLAQKSDAEIDYGKTQTREDMLKGYTQAMDFYFAEEPDYHEVLICEEKLEAVLTTVFGDTLPLPAVGIPDLVVKNEDGSIDIVDVKFVKSFTDYQTEDYLKIIQAQFLDHLLRAAKGITAKQVIFREVKRTANSGEKEGSPQIRDWVVPLDHGAYRVFFYNLYRDVVKYLSHDPIFLPNIADPMDGEQAGLIYAQGLISADMSDVEVMHKVRDVAYTSKKFVPSRLDSEINKHLLPEEKVKVRLAEFGIPVEPVDVKVGASVTQYRFKVSARVRMSTVRKHVDDIARALEAKGDVRVLAPIPGTSFIGIEVENPTRSAVKLAKHHLAPGTLAIPVGVDVNGDSISLRLDEMPHLLIAGTTGSGKSVLLHTIITALTKQLRTDELELVLIDPKRVELAAFARSRHLRCPVIVKYEDAVRALLTLSEETESRYKILERAGKRDIREFNDSKRDESKRLPYIVTVIDEFADLMLQSRAAKKAPTYGSKSKRWLYREILKRAGKRGEIFVPDEDSSDEMKLRKVVIGAFADYDRDTLADILEAHDALDPAKTADIETIVVRLAQMARAVGIHLILATQRPSADVITGLIKANFPTRIALTTASPTDSTIILGVPGAEKLSGKGDMLFMSPSLKGLQRLQAYYC